ncbi:MAG TPA: BrnA antitoxin family protein [Caulobacteraceae bacterium]|nr:BrnA antitoxin family protein [Caulobacteraceae bacterium]
MVEFDPAKDAANVAKHSVSLASAEEFDFANAVIITDDRFDYGETRFRAFAYTGDEGRCLVFTVTGDQSIRVISYRRARRKEMRQMGSEPKTAPGADFDDNPEWTKADFVKARPASEVLPVELYRVLTRRRGPAKQPTKRPVSIRLSARVLDHYRAQGTGWQTRLNADLEGLIARSGPEHRRP